MLRHKLKQRLFEAIRDAYPNTCPIDRLNGLCDELGYKESCGERRCRELCQAGAIQRIMSDKNYVVGYKYIPPPTAVFTEQKQNALFNLRPNALFA